MNRAKIVTETSALALALLAATPAQAAGTAAGTVITNQAAISFKVNTLDQTVAALPASVTVDRVVNLTLAEVGSTTTVAPGQTRAVVTYSMTNTSNATLDFAPTMVQLSGGAAKHGGTDTFDVANGGFIVDTNGNNTYEAGTDLSISYFDEVPADASRTFFYVADIPQSLANGAVAGLVATTTAAEGGASGAQGAALIQTNGANTTGVDTVFADGAGSTDAARDAAFSAGDDFTVSTAMLTVTRTNRVISDTVNGTTNPKAIPGATVEYCVAIANATGAPTAVNVTIADTLGSFLTYDSTFGVYQNGTVTGGVCDTAGPGAGTAGGTFGSGKVNGTIASIAAGEIKTIRYRVTVD